MIFNLKKATEQNPSGCGKTFKGKLQVKQIIVSKTFLVPKWVSYYHLL